MHGNSPSTQSFSNTSLFSQELPRNFCRSAIVTTFDEMEPRAKLTLNGLDFRHFSITKVVFTQEFNHNVIIIELTENFKWANCIPWLIRKFNVSWPTKASILLHLIIIVSLMRTNMESSKLAHVNHERNQYLLILHQSNNRLTACNHMCYVWGPWGEMHIMPTVYINSNHKRYLSKSMSG